MSCAAPAMRDQAAFEAGLAAVPGAPEGARCAVALLSSRGLNASFRIVTARGAFVLRIADAGERAALLGVDRRREHLLHALAAAAGVAPPVLAASDDGRWQVRPFVPGAHWCGDDFAAPRQLERLAAVLHRLQGIVAPALPAFDPLPLLERWRAVLTERRPSDGAMLDAALESVRTAFAHVDAGRRVPCIVHGDLHGENIVDGDGLCLIDWEYAQVADPLAEIGSLLAAHPQLARHVPLLLATTGLAARAEPGELAAWTAAYRCLNSFWQRLTWGP